MAVITPTAMPLLPSGAAATAVCPPGQAQKENPYDYIKSLIDALGYAKSAGERTTQLSQESSAYDFMVSLKLGKADFECAGIKVAPFRGSRSQAIDGSARGATLVFSELAGLQDQAVDQLKVAVDSLRAGTFKPGTAAERQAALAASYDEVWKLLIQAAILGTYAVVAEDPQTKLMSRLALTGTQRDELLRALRTTFGDGIVQGMKAGQSSLFAAGGVLYQVIGDPQRKAKDAP